MNYKFFNLVVGVFVWGGPVQAACPDTLSYDQLKRFKIGLPVSVNGTEFNPVTTRLTDSNLALEITAKLQTTSQASDSISCTYDLNATPQISGALVIKGKLVNTLPVLSVISVITPMKKPKSKQAAV